MDGVAYRFEVRLTQRYGQHSMVTVQRGPQRFHVAGPATTPNHPRTPRRYASPRAAQATAVTVNGSEGTRRWHSARNAMRWAALRLAR